MPIYPLPQFEADVKEQLDADDRRAYEALKTPKTLVVRFGAMKLVGEFPYQGDVKPGCGSKLIIRTFRGTELGEMLTSTCSNNGCGKSVSRQEMLQYIENSGGRDYPFFTDGRVLRIATREDLDKQAALEQSKHALRFRAREIAQRLGVHAKIVDVEPVLGGESVTVFYLSEERIEVRELIQNLAKEFRTHVEVRHVGARDEARLTADYEKCGQYCCCKNFLKVLRPISMKSAKVQKATLDPLKISGRCGRLMCCLRYEDETYEDLRKRLPRKKSRVGTPEGDGIVLDGQILTQLVLVELDEIGTDGKIRQVAIPVENLTPPVSSVTPVRPMPDFGPRGPRGPMPPRPAPAGPPQATPPQAATTETLGTGDATRGPRPPRPRDDRPRENRGGPRDGPRDGAPREGGRPPGDRPARGPARGPGGGPSGGQGGNQGGGPSAGPNGGQGGGPSGGPGAGRGPSRPQGEPPKSRDDEIDDLMAGLDSEGAPPSDRPEGGEQGRRRRRRRGRGRGPGGPPQGGTPPPG